MPLQEHFVVHMLGLAMINRHTKYEVSTISYNVGVMQRVHLQLKIKICIF